jgi:hypothetical protein
MIGRTLVHSVMAPTMWVTLATFIAPLAVNAQAPGCPSVGQPGAFLCSLGAEAQRAADPAGDLKYATELIGMITPHVSREDRAQMARRLASADQAARHDTGRYVPESSVAAAFNELMAQVRRNNATSFRTDAETVHSLRGILAGNSPALTSLKEHPTSCLPDEAVLLVYLLIFNNGRVGFVPRGQSLLSVENSMAAEDAADNAQMKLDEYLAARWELSNMVLFNKLLHNLGIKP